MEHATERRLHLATDVTRPTTTSVSGYVRVFLVTMGVPGPVTAQHHVLYGLSQASRVTVFLHGCNNARRP